MQIFGFEVYHEYIIEYVEAVEHNSWTFEVHFDTFWVFQTAWGILYGSEPGFRNLSNWTSGHTSLLPTDWHLTTN